MTVRGGEVGREQLTGFAPEYSTKRPVISDWASLCIHQDSGLLGQEVQEVDRGLTGVEETNLAPAHPAAVEVERVLVVSSQTGTVVTSSCVLAYLGAVVS